MATSGNTINVLTRDDIINGALRKLVVLGEGQTATAAQITAASQALNIITAEFRTLGMQAWARTEYQLIPVAGQDTYIFGVGQQINIPYPNFIYSVEVHPGPTNLSHILMNQLAIIDFNLLPNGSKGMPVNYNYQPGNNIGTFRIWPTPDITVPVGTFINITYQRPIEVFNSSSDNPDFPQEWGNALIYQLALDLCDEYGVADSKQSRIERLADKHLATALSNTNEQGSLFLGPDWRQWESLNSN